MDKAEAEKFIGKYVDIWARPREGGEEENVMGGWVVYVSDETTMVEYGYGAPTSFITKMVEQPSDAEKFVLPANYFEPQTCCPHVNGLHYGIPGETERHCSGCYVERRQPVNH